VLCTQQPAQYARWREKATSGIEAAFPVTAGKKPNARLQRERDKALVPYPADLVAALCAETGWLQECGWSAAPGSREVLYWRRSAALEVGPPVPLRAEHGVAVSMALLALSTSSRNSSGLPSTERVYPQGRLLHKALALAIERTGTCTAAMPLLGRDRGQVGESNHRHAHLLHLDLDGDARLDHVLVWVPAGLGVDGQRALRRVRQTWMKGGVGALQVSLSGAGSAELLRSLDEQFEGRLARALGPAGGAQDWVSATPFVAPRMTKKRGRDSLEGQINEGLTRRGLPSAEVELLDPRGELRLSFRHFVLHDREHAPPKPITHAVRLRFARPVEGPLCLGYGSHYGLGRFETM
jgi:CRISPR-associated protein Csb2